MRTNISNLMSIVAEEERKFNTYGCNLQDYVYNITIQELNGTENVIEDYQDDFILTMEEYRKTQEKISKIKSLIYEKNNSLTLPDGRTIQQAIVDNTNMRKMKSIYLELLSKRNSKQRVTEVNNSYFECKTINFNVEQLKKEYEDLESKIRQTDFEISKLNSIEFEADI